jgi:hypothetical protein
MTFWQWLKRQRDRDDPVGDVSRDALADKHRKGTTRAWWVEHLTQHGACDGALRAIEEAWKEYRAAAICGRERSGSPQPKF